MALLGLRFCARAFSSCGKWGPLFIVVRGPLIITASLVAEHRLQMHRLSNCGSRAQLLRGMWDPPRPGLEPVSPALAGRPSTNAPPGKPPLLLLILFFVFNFCQFDYYVSQHVPPWLYPAWDSLCFLNLDDCSLFHVRNVFSHYLFKYFLRLFFSLFSFWDP